MLFKDREGEICMKSDEDELMKRIEKTIKRIRKSKPPKKRKLAERSLESEGRHEAWLRAEIAHRISENRTGSG